MISKENVRIVITISKKLDSRLKQEARTKKTTVSKLIAEIIETKKGLQ